MPWLPRKDEQSLWRVSNVVLQSNTRSVLLWQYFDYSRSKWVCFGDVGNSRGYADQFCIFHFRPGFSILFSVLPSPSSLGGLMFEKVEIKSFRTLAPCARRFGSEGHDCEGEQDACT